MEQYLRKVRLEAKGSGGSLKINEGGINLHDLKIGFSITKGISSTQNSAQIKIWNLSQSSRNSLGKELDDITLEAGYLPANGGGNVSIIFKGQIRDVEHTRDGADIITTLSCGEGDKAFRNSMISKTYKAGTPTKDVLEDIYKEFEKEGVTKGEWKLPEDVGEFKRPYSVCGTCKREADQLSRSKGFYWSIQNGTMEVIPSDGYVGGVVFISAETGLIDSPTITDNGIKFKALLNPAVRPNRRVQVKSLTLEMNSENGEYRVGQVSYQGDNRDGDFTINVEAESLNGKKVNEGKRKVKKTKSKKKPKKAKKD